MKYGFTGNLKKTQRVLIRGVKLKLTGLISGLSYAPVPVGKSDIKKISGRSNTCRARVSYARALYEVYWSDKVVKVLKAGRRYESAYKR